MKTYYSIRISRKLTPLVLLLALCGLISLTARAQTPQPVIAQLGRTVLYTGTTNTVATTFNVSLPVGTTNLSVVVENTGVNNVNGTFVFAQVGFETGTQSSSLFCALSVFSGGSGPFSTSAPVVPAGGAQYYTCPPPPAGKFQFTFSANVATSFWTISVFTWSGLPPYPSAILADPCNNPAVPKNTAFANITTATTTQIIAPVGVLQVFVCQIVAQLNSTTASTVFFEVGSGATCGTGTTVKSATYTNAALVSENVTLGGGSADFMTAGAGQGVCAVTTVGATPTIPVTISFVQQ